MKQVFVSLRDTFLRLLFQRTVTILTIVFCIGVLVVLGNLYYFSRYLVRNQALEYVSQSASALKQARSLYNSEIVSNLQDIETVEVTHNYKYQDNAIPLPATYLRELGFQLSQKSDGMQVRLYSNYPFPWRGETGKPQDNFEKEALKQLQQNPNTPFYRFQTLANRPVLRYAQAEVMKPQCIDCHNSYPRTPKTDWKVGDVRGILEINQSLESTTTKVRQSLKITTLGFGSLSVIGVAALGLAIRRLQNYSRQLEQKVRIRQQAMDEAFTQIHNGPLQTLALLLKDSQTRELPQTSLVTKLKALNREIREIGHNLTAEEAIETISSFKGQKSSQNNPKLRLGEGTLIDLNQPLHELFYETFTVTLTRDFPYFSGIRVKVRDFDPIPDSSINIELKRELCMWLEEALCNVGKHAQGTTRVIAMGKKQEDKYILKVQDNGSGLVIDAMESQGTKSCHKLAKRLKGNFKREALQVKGTVCALSWTIKRK